MIQRGSFTHDFALTEANPQSQVHPLRFVSAVAASISEGRELEVRWCGGITREGVGDVWRLRRDSIDACYPWAWGRDPC